MDWITKQSTEGRSNGIKWTLWKQLDDLDFADDIALLVHTYHQMQEKTTQLEESTAKLGLSASKVNEVHENKHDQYHSHVADGRH